MSEMSEAMAKAAKAAEAALAAEADEAAPAEGAKGDAKQGADGAAQGAEEPAKAPKPEPLFAMSYRGRPLEVPVAEAKRLAEQGYDYSAKMAALNAKRAELEKEETLLKEFREYRDYLKANPALAQHMEQLTREYDTKHVLPRFDYAEGKPAEAGMSTAAQERIERIERYLMDQAAAAREARLGAEVARAVNSRPTFAASPKLAELAVLKLEAALKADPTASIDALAAAHEADVRAVLNTQPAADYERKKAEQRASFGVTERPAGLAAAQERPTRPNYTWDDLMNGRAAQAAAAALEAAKP